MTIIILLITSIFSIIAFNKPELMNKYQFNPYKTYHGKEWYRLFSHALLHLDWMHLIVNMFVLLSFGQVMEEYFQFYFRNVWIIYYTLLYVGGVVVSTLYTLIKQKDNYYYNAIGASGAVSAVVFASILFSPTSRLLIMGIIPIPAILFGVLYLVYSYYMSKKNIDNVGHDAHFWGAVYGFVFPILLRPELLKQFLSQIIGAYL